MSEKDLMFTVIEGMCEAGILPTLPTLCLRTKRSKDELLELLVELDKDGRIEWLTEDIVISLPKPEWYIDYVRAVKAKNKFPQKAY
ncbi:hypothetical protein [Alkalihalobacillus pseudalcaliphilus]|uniref:hypothetical protein n=1 Tax=Alkalihalobacillus pseudalcaliphilus TaxID=79884 RepID=UPI00064DDCB4|nr:hypothetical protein [Alkalihalobacillus pseudalcaliphilus]KMK77571.1 hypothetical protein AB990_03655 [Alkalihalobacillus pseudalcaliphilus]